MAVNEILAAVDVKEVPVGRVITHEREQISAEVGFCVESGSKLVSENVTAALSGILGRGFPFWRGPLN